MIYTKSVRAAWCGLHKDHSQQAVTGKNAEEEPDETKQGNTGTGFVFDN